MLLAEARHVTVTSLFRTGPVGATIAIGEIVTKKIDRPCAEGEGEMEGEEHG